MTVLGFAAPAIAQSTIDRVRRQNGADSGQITAVTALGVTISKNGVESTIPSEEIQSVYLAGEPAELNSARNAIQTGHFHDAEELLAKINVADVQREEILADVEFYKALAKARGALAGQGDGDAALPQVRSFLSGRRTSFHVPEAIELLGDLLSGSGKYADARTEYAKLALAKSRYYELRSAWLAGRAWQGEGDQKKALAEFAKVTSATEAGSLFDPLKLSATLDQAVSQAASGKVEEASAAIGKIIAGANPEDAKLLARAYNALGDCYLKAGDQRAALYMFLHVDLLYNHVADAHAKALRELVTLWKATGHENRAQEAAQKLAEKYPDSRAAKP